MTQRFCTVGQAAELMVCSRRMVQQLVQRRELPAFRLGRTIRIPVAELEQYIAEHTEGGVAWQANAPTGRAVSTIGRTAKSG